jgi:hypothetical protein
MRDLRKNSNRGRKLSVAAVAAQLNSEGHTNRSGRPWSAQMVHHVLATAVSH